MQEALPAPAPEEGKPDPEQQAKAKAKEARERGQKLLEKGHADLPEVREQIKDLAKKGSEITVKVPGQQDMVIRIIEGGERAHITGEFNNFYLNLNPTNILDAVKGLTEVDIMAIAVIFDHLKDAKVSGKKIPVARAKLQDSVLHRGSMAAQEEFGDRVKSIEEGEKALPELIKELQEAVNDGTVFNIKVGNGVVTLDLDSGEAVFSTADGSLDCEIHWDKKGNLIKDQSTLSNASLPWMKLILDAIKDHGMEVQARRPYTPLGEKLEKEGK